MTNKDIPETCDRLIPSHLILGLGGFDVLQDAFKQLAIEFLVRNGEALRQGALVEIRFKIQSKDVP